MDDRKTSCETNRLNEDGSTVKRNKVKYETLEDAIAECKKQNVMPLKIEKLIPYKCTVCHKYHIGRNGTLITDKYREKLKAENRKEKIKIFNDNLKNAKLKVIGKVDLSKFDVIIKIRKNGSRKIKYK